MSRGKLKYTKEFLEPIVKESKSIAEVIRRSGAKMHCGNHRYFRTRIDFFGLDCSHFTGSAWNKDRKTGARVHWSEKLVISSKGYRIQGYKLAAWLIESGRKYECAHCKNEGFWMGEKLGLEVDHINEDYNNNLPENLQFLCPNCHSVKSKKFRCSGI